MNIAFWNINRQNNKHINDLLRSKKLDMCFLAEAQNYTIDLLEGYKIFSSYKNHLMLIYKSKFDIIRKQEESRYIICVVNHQNDTFIFVALHLEDTRNCNSDDRKDTIRKIVGDIIAYEQEFKTKNTIVLGDFNSNPFDDELVQVDCFNSVMYSDYTKTKIYHERKIEKFYNPMLNLFSEKNKAYGSYFYNQGNKPLYWYFFDQVIYRPKLIESIALDKIEYLKVIKDLQLVKDGKPNNRISDHLPLYFELSIGDLL